MGDQKINITIAGRSVAAGLVIGNAFVYRERLEVLAGPSAIEAHQIQAELQHLDRAMATVAEDLRVSSRRIEADTTAKLAEIFQTHEAILHDPGLRQEIRTLIQDELISPAQALVRVFRRWERKFREMTAQTHQNYANDVADLGHRLLREMVGIKTTSLEKMPPGRVLIARRLLPSDTVALPRSALAGIVVEFGGPGSHAALLAEALAIPTVAQIPGLLDKVGDEDVLVVDGSRGEVVINPDETTRAYYAGAIQAMEARPAQASPLARQPARTLDGTVVAVQANVGCLQDAATAAHNGADGVGLYRMEQYYLARKTPPNAAELLAELRAVFAPMADRPLTIRLLDLGGDKPLPFLQLPVEDNPFLGRRGVRLLLQYPDLLNTQLRALCRFSQDYDVRILVPMVTLAEEMACVRDRFTAAAKEVGQGTLPPLGAMIETPAAALSVPELAEQADFLSIGTNDLTQYTMAAGRENPLVDDYFQEDHPAVLRLIRIVIEEAGRLPVSVCGELARQLSAVPTLLKLGIRTLSVAPPLVPEVKKLICLTAL